MQDKMGVASCELHVASCEVRVASCEFLSCEFLSCELRVACCELRVACCELRVLENCRAHLQSVYSVNLEKLKGTSCD